MSNFRSALLLLFLAIISINLSAQVSFEFSQRDVKARLKKDIQKLASDEMEGREAGTAGEVLAARYIASQMEQIGLKPLFDGSFFQEFQFPGQWQFGKDNQLIIAGEEFFINRDYFVLPSSASASIEAKAIYVGHGMDDPSYSDYDGIGDTRGMIFFMEYYLPAHLDGNSDLQPLVAVQRKMEVAIGKGALAVIFVNTQSSRPDPPTGLNQRLGRENIPVLFAKSEVFEYWQQQGEGKEIKLSAELRRETLPSINVAGYLDNQAPYTVVIGGHYDHLGFGGAGSRSQGVRAIHPGADDNASGTAGVLETARFLSQGKHKGFNYLFIAFSAEEKGLLGSRHFVESKAYDLSRVNFMFNFDMIGRLDNALTIYGTGTSPSWDSAIDKTSGKLTVRKSPSGVGGSDHTNFYRHNIPVLFFFTGIHEDYHRPSDTEDKINYQGAYDVLQMSYHLIAHFEGKDRLAFTETPGAARETARRQGPALGVMPDHAFDGQGMRVQSVSENNPAKRAGIKDGDVIIRIGDVRVNDIQTYMQAMGSVGNSRNVTVVVVREGAEMAIEVAL